MPSLRKISYLLLVSPLFLTACGEGYEIIRTDKYAPYGNQRTAGTGVAYVLAQMLPKKELKIEPVTDVRQPKQMGEEVLKELQEVFREKQKK